MKIRVIKFFLIAVLLNACNKDLSRSNQGQNNQTGILGTAGTVLIKRVDIWNPGDTTTTTYQYDAANQLISSQSNIAGNNINIYQRDDLERLTAIFWVNNNDTSSVTAHYINATSTQVAYSISLSSFNGANYVDSDVYFYNQNKLVQKIISYLSSNGSIQISSYDSFRYDANSNLLQLQMFTPDTSGNFSLNIDYEFEYDNGLNPLYSHDDLRLPTEWGGSASPSNIIKQTNIYGNPPQRNSDYVALTYGYQSHNEPSSSIESGTAIADTVHSSFYYQ